MEAPPTFNDIVLPAAPALTSTAPAQIIWPWFAAALVGLLLLSWSARRRWRLRHLRRIARDWRSGLYDNRDTVFLLAAQLARQLHVSQLPAELPRVQSPRLQSRWQRFVGLLDRVRYERSQIGDSEVSAVLRETQFWLLRAHVGIWART